MHMSTQLLTGRSKACAASAMRQHRTSYRLLKRLLSRNSPAPNMLPAAWIDPCLQGDKVLYKYYIPCWFPGQSQKGIKETARMLDLLPSVRPSTDSGES
jgi:hypothetical protein